MVKHLPYNVGELGSTLGSRRSSGEMTTHSSRKKKMFFFLESPTDGGGGRLQSMQSQIIGHN